jgi:hypothetical protein
MKTFKNIDDVYCDCCGKSTTNNPNVGPDYGTLESCWGFGSKHDETRHNIDLCETCFYEVIDFIKQKRSIVLGPFKYPHDIDPLDGTRYI